MFAIVVNTSTIVVLVFDISIIHSFVVTCYVFICYLLYLNLMYLNRGSFKNMSTSTIRSALDNVVVKFHYESKSVPDYLLIYMLKMKLNHESFFYHRVKEYSGNPFICIN